MRHVYLIQYKIEMNIIKAFIVKDTTHHVTIIMENDKPLFRADEIAKILDVKNVRTSIAKFDKITEKTIRSTDSATGYRDTNFFTQKGVIKFVMQSRSEKAAAFQDWVIGVILSISETGKYELQAKYNELEAIISINESDKNELQAKYNELEANVLASLTIEAKKFEDIVAIQRHITLVESFRGFPDKYVVYLGIIRILENGKSLVKIGSTKDIKRRSEEHIKELGSMTLFKIFECELNEPFERFLQQHKTISAWSYKEIVYDGRRSNEVFEVTSVEITLMISIATRNVHNFRRHNTPEQVLELVREELAEATALKKLEDVRPKDNHHEPVIIQPLTMAEHRRFTQVRGEKIQRYTIDAGGDTFTLDATYSGTIDAVRKSRPTVSRTALMIAIKNCTIYRGFRWMKLERKMDDNTLQIPSATVASQPSNTGKVAFLDLNKTRIEMVFPDQKAASANRKFSNGAAICKAMKEGTKSGGYYPVRWDDCSVEMQNDYLARNGGIIPEKNVRGNGVEVTKHHPIAPHALIKKFPSITDVIIELHVNRDTLKEAINFNRILNGFIWRFVVKDVVV